MAEGLDFESARRVLKSVTSAKAVAKLPGWPYSIATNVAHTEQWQRRWLNQLKGLPALDIYRDGVDFPVVSEAEWPELRARMVEGLDEAHSIARADPFAHHLKSEEAAFKKLTQIALHASYHLGQVKLLKRLMAQKLSC